jgi:hypothetical protein
VTIVGIMGLGMMICFRLKVETIIIPFRLIPIFLCFNLVQSPIAQVVYFLFLSWWFALIAKTNNCEEIAIQPDHHHKKVTMISTVTFFYCAFG